MLKYRHSLPNILLFNKLPTPPNKFPVKNFEELKFKHNFAAENKKLRERQREMKERHERGPVICKTFIAVCEERRSEAVIAGAHRQGKR